ncbi:acyl carrier protein [Streptomyces sp. MCAF7]
MENGLTSLTALELAKGLMSATGLEVPLVAVVEHPTSALLGKYLSEAYEANVD